MFALDPQKLIDAISAIGMSDRSKYHLTLGQLIHALEGMDGSLLVRFDRGENPGEFGSYRGYYSDLMLELTDDKVTAGALLARARAANGYTFQGYKGGDFTMDDNTPLWRATYGCCGEAIIGINASDTELVLVTKEVD